MKLSSTLSSILFLIANRKVVAALNYTVQCEETAELVGYKSTADIMNDIIESDSVDPLELVLCPNTVFEVDGIDEGKKLQEILAEGLKNPPVYILRDGTVLKCGSNGSSENNCVFKGGDTQILSMFDTSGTLLQGITFESVPKSESFSANILAGGPASSNIKFEDCHFKGNNGDAVVYIHAFDMEDTSETTDENTDENLDGTGRRMLEKASMTWGENLRRLEESTDVSAGMEVILNACTFQGNSNTDGFAIANLNAQLNVAHTSFDSNEYSAIIGTGAGGITKVSNCCFTNNKANWPGIALVETESKHMSSLTYVDESNASFQCKYVFQEQKANEDCQMDPTACEGICIEADGAQCQAENVLTANSRKEAEPTLGGTDEEAGKHGNQIAGSLKSPASMVSISKSAVLAASAILGWMVAYA